MSVPSPPKIRKLDEVVVNRIAAGEVIQRPANALKELLENSLDAKANNIQITVKDGGLKLLQIQDNGTGIRKEDLGIVCERYTTSKLQNFDDLKSISTYGFRGEALASISHVAYLTITTKTASAQCAYKASYTDSQLKGQPTPCAGNQGTVITIENLFYNVPTRRKVLSHATEEFHKIVEVVERYAVHNPTVGFTLKKHNDVGTQVRTPGNSTKTSNIKTIFGNSVARELFQVDLKDETYQFELHALVTNPNYSSKRMTLLLFINNRLVDSHAIRKMLEELYSIYLPKKSHPFCYISLELNPANVDVNVHPTKHEVRFLHEDMIVEKIKIALDERLSSDNASRTFYMQARLPKVSVTQEVLKKVLPEFQKSSDSTKKVYAHEMVRTNSNDQKLDRFNFTVNQSPDIEKSKSKGKSKKANDFSYLLDSIESGPSQRGSNLESDAGKEMENLSNGANETSNETQQQSQACRDEIAERARKKILQYFSQPSITPSPNTRNEEKKNSPMESFKSYSVNNFRREIRLHSILTLRKEVEDNHHEGLRGILKNSTFVGCCDETTILLQSGLNLYICNFQKLAEELFYEILLYDFANFGLIKFSKPIPLKALARIALDTSEVGWSKKHGTKEELAENTRDLLLEKADMLNTYFSMVLDKHGNLKSLPILLENYIPSMAELPLFVLRLAAQVNWMKEKPCFHDICRETAKFYSHVNTKGTKNGNWKHTIEHTVYPAIKQSLLPPKHFSHDSTILQISSLPDLYKIFERC